MSKLFKPVVVSGKLAEVRDTAVYVEKKTELDFGKQDLVQHDAFIRSLADKNTRAFNIENLFEQNLRPLIGDVQLTDYDHALQIAENDGRQQVAATTVTALAKDGKNTTEIHIILNKEFNRALIVGDAAPKGVKAAFAKAGIRYVDRNSKTALEDIKAGIADVVGTKTGRVADAFLYRNDVTQKAVRNDLAKMLANKKNQPLYAKYLVKT